MADTEEDDAHQTIIQLSSCFSEGFNAVAVLGVIPEWATLCETVAASERKQRVLEGLSQLLSVAPLIELPRLHGPKPMLRRCVAVAAELHALVVAWDDTTEPTPEMATTARRFYDCLNDPEKHLDLP